MKLLDVHATVQLLTCVSCKGMVHRPLVTSLIRRFTYIIFIIVSFATVQSVSAQVSRSIDTTLPDPSTSGSRGSCDSRGLDSSFEYIDAVEIGSTRFQTGNNDGYHSDDAQKIELYAGVDTDIRLEPGYQNDSFLEAWKIWIDYNKDGFFDNDTEVLFSMATDTVIISEISIATSIAKGVYDIRVSMQYQKSPLPCTDVPFGEVEDYKITVMHACDIGSACDDGDLCTLDDKILEDCTCAGVYIDADQDGLCIGLDEDDQNACLPITTNCDPCNNIYTQDFESGYGDWVDGGGDCSIVDVHMTSGNSSLRLRDNSGTGSSITSPIISVSSLEEILLSFSFLAVSMESDEGFLLELSSDAGGEYRLIKRWTHELDFENLERISASVTIPAASADTYRLRLRTDASSNGDMIYIDDITIVRCTVSDAQSQNTIVKTDDNAEVSDGTEIDANHTKRSLEDLRSISLSIYPNPTAGHIIISSSADFSEEYFSMTFIDIYGKVVKYLTFVSLSENSLTINANDLESGIFIVILESSGGFRHTEKVMIKK